MMIRRLAASVSLCAAILLLGFLQQENALIELAGVGGLRRSIVRARFRRDVPLQGFRDLHGVERRTDHQAPWRQRRKLRCHLTFERRRNCHRGGRLALPLDLSQIPSYSQLSPQLTSLTLVRINGQVYGVPFMWGPDPLIYDTTAFPKTPDTWNVLWDPKYRGKISVWDDLSTVYMTAQILGFDKPDPSQLYNLTDEQLDAVKKKLLELKPNVRKMWSTGGELTNLFQNHEVVAAMGWPLMTNQLRKINFPVGETIPKENTTGWIDHLMITAGSENKELAHKFLEYMVAGADPEEGN